MGVSSKAPSPQPDRSPWSQCKACGRFEWNSALSSNDCKCSKCGRKVRLYKPRSKDPNMAQVAGGAQATQQGAVDE
eukprot:5974447-Pyramimonas_sp.AAC.1